MRIAILGSRGIPNYHGGFEQFAENFSVYLVENGHQVYVYNSSLHPYQNSTYKGVHIIHCRDLENKLGTSGQFVYDFNCIRDSSHRNFDIILQLGYTSSSVWHRFLPKKPAIITNMDGLEWKRSKYSKAVKSFLKYAEKLAVQSSDYLISDSIGIQNYIRQTYNQDSKYIAYGSTVIEEVDETVLGHYGLEAYGYNMLIARMEPENNIETVLDGVRDSESSAAFLVIGNYTTNAFGKYIYQKFNASENIIFLGAIYNQEHLNALRWYSNLYFHGHSVGGTNPSLLEAMASGCLVVAHDNDFNRAVLHTDGFYFKNKNDISSMLETLSKKNHGERIVNNKNKIKQHYSWEMINRTYLNYFVECLKTKSDN
ncbi:glycosyltransferase family 1 protein [Psychroflexus sp. YR1-1]|uniref:Glycosyltransferase family 1 protein n=1 Tax=Psychroflexus aurantiacus TaxID=2709310 RepID=A0A6B3R1I5_9FLAO|nr:DUF1972 domain-containing protein [Psychroflexus aurantiacus]NEV94506.1 glycosyltransferase family 1 protein [Psychroflexus aurantiacus]